MEEDRISQLPDSILLQILSLIDINEAVQTTILSTRWKNLPFSLDDCLHYAANRGVQSLRLRAPNCSPPLYLPAALFMLRELDLRHFSSGVHLPSQICFPCLKSLNLEFSVFIDGGDHSCTVLKEPFSGFPELEKLTLHCYAVSGLVVKAPKLRFLEIVDDGMAMKEISALLLTSFRYEGALPFECSEVNIPMLEEVYLDIHGIRYNVKRKHMECVRMLHQLGNATTVSLTLDTLKVLAMDGTFIEQSPPPFPHIKCLILVKGRGDISTVLQKVMDYLTVGTLYYESTLMVEIPHGVVVVEESSHSLFDDDDCNYELEVDLFD